jgi:hypothetical protein
MVLGPTKKSFKRFANLDFEVISYTATIVIVSYQRILY